MSQSVSTSPDQERYTRRLSDKIQSAFDHACDEGELEVAGDLLSTLELVLLRVPPKADRREAIVAPLMAAHERLWHLRAVGGKMVLQFAKDSEPAAKTELSG
jgi:hypothetical protein